ncbi:HVA22-like protein k [Quercus robur]|uniref:HVA22-like protein k n=1 Tax=Quercus robur TaxID=38942 RepID=UPI002161363B|nr:HVA22-like protein k [Quercus robur]XP_050263020.1 HVA22-like protein k [Quercus robur]
MVSGGHMVLTIIGSDRKADSSGNQSCTIWELLGITLNDMVQEIQNPLCSSFPLQKHMVGLGLLLCRLGSNVVVQTVSCSIGIALAVYKTFKAIEEKDQDEQQWWLLYWAAYGSFSLAEVFADKLLSWFPLYYHVKFAFLVWLQLPSANGSKDLYMSHLRPFLLKH